MKKSIVGVMAMIAFFAASFVWYSCTKEFGEEKGSIYGFVTDAATGEAVANANVILLKTGEAAITGSDGMYEFLDVISGEYSIKVSKVEYSDLLDDYVIEVKDGKRVRRDVQIEKLPVALRIVDGNGEDISTLDFGAEQDVTSRTFSIFNDSPGKITWWIEENCPWITEVMSMRTHEQAGELEAGRQEPIKVTINRESLGEGVKTYILNINSDHGSRELTITAGEDIGLPSLSTDPVSNLTQTTVTFNGTILNEGTPSYIERGFVYSSSAQPTIENNLGRITSAVNNQMTFSANVSGLTPYSSYYVRAYAINDIGVEYGNDIAFSTGSLPTEVSTSAPTNVSATAATLHATITVEGSPAYTERGFCYNTAGDPTISHNKIVVSGSGTGTYSTNVSNLSYPATYHVKAYAIQNGQPIYGNEVSFSTSMTSTQVQTSAVSNILATSATFNGSITNEGSPSYTEKGFCYSTSPNPTISNIKKVVTGSGSGNYSCNVTNLEYQTTYYVSAYAIQDGQPVYGTVVNFTTAWTDSEVQTLAVNNVSTTSARFNGNVVVAGTPAYTERGFCYDNTSSMPTVSNNRIMANSYMSGGPAGNYNKNVTGLVSGETYYVRSYVVQNGEYIYGDVVSFATNALPVVHTNNVSNLAQSSLLVSWNVTFHGYVESTGSPAYIERGFVYGTGYNPTNASTKIVVSGTGTGSFSANVTGLQNFNIYHVRAYAKTSSGTYVYGEDVSFSTYD